MKTLNATDRAAERLAGSWASSSADEREQTVISQAAGFGLMVGVLGSYFWAALLAVAGQFLAPMALLIAPAVSGAAAWWFASRRGVVIGALAGRGWRRDIPLLTGLIGLAVITVMGLLHTLLNGEGIFQVTVINEIPQQTDEVSAGWLAGAALIFATLTLLLVFAMVLFGRRRERRLEAAADQG